MKKLIKNANDFVLAVLMLALSLFLLLYTEFADEFVRQIIQKITVEDEETIRIHFRDSEMVIEQEL